MERFFCTCLFLLGIKVFNHSLWGYKSSRYSGDTLLIPAPRRLTLKTLFTRSLVVASLVLSGGALADTALLNVSYDVTRDFYKDYNPAFQKYWKAKTGENIT